MQASTLPPRLQVLDGLDVPLPAAAGGDGAAFGDDGPVQADWRWRWPAVGAGWGRVRAGARGSALLTLCDGEVRQGAEPVERYTMEPEGRVRRTLGEGQRALSDVLVERVVEWARAVVEHEGAPVILWFALDGRRPVALWWASGPAPQPQMLDACGPEATPLRWSLQVVDDPALAWVGGRLAHRPDEGVGPGGPWRWWWLLGRLLRRQRASADIGEPLEAALESTGELARCRAWRRELEQLVVGHARALGLTDADDLFCEASPVDDAVHTLRNHVLASPGLTQLARDGALERKVLESEPSTREVLESLYAAGGVLTAELLAQLGTRDPWEDFAMRRLRAREALARRGSATWTGLRAGLWLAVHEQVSAQLAELERARAALHGRALEAAHAQAAELVAAGRLDAIEDVHWLTASELLDVRRGAPPTDLAAQVRIRRAAVGEAALDA